MAQDETFIYRPNKSNEWYTPPFIIGAATQVLGEIDLDPASCAAANIIVKARRFYTSEENGLKLPWTTLDGRPSRVWLNPPYGRSLDYSTGNIGLFVHKLLAEYQMGHVSEAILLTTVQNDAKWFRDLWQFPICFTDHKIHFRTTRPTKKSPTATHMFGTAFVYLGENIEKFKEVFDYHIGVVVPAMRKRGQPDLWQDIA